MAWIILVGAGLLEIVFAVALKFSEGFTKFWPSAISFTAAAVSFFMLSIALASLPLGTAYAVWTGIGALGTALVGIVVLGESASLVRVGLFLLIVVGIVGLQVTET